MNKRKVEGYARDTEEESLSMIKESLLRRKAEVEKMPRELKERAQ